VCAIFLGLWLGFRSSFSIPKNSAFLLSVTPRTVHQGLKPEEERALPAVWRTALQGDSRWPVVLGAHHQADQWRFFALVPRWSDASSDSDKHQSAFIRDRQGLVSLLSDTALPQSERKLSYLDQSKWWQGDPGASFAFWMDPRAFLSGAIADQRLQPFIGHFKRRVIYTDIDFSVFGGPPLKWADISLNFPNDSSARSLASAFLDALGLSDLPFKAANLDPVQISVIYDEKNAPSDTILRFKEQIETEQARQIFGFLGLTKRIISKLEDGTLIEEQVLPLNTDPSAYLGQKISPSLGTVEIIGSEIHFGKNTQVIENIINKPNSCPEIHAEMRLSTRALSFFISNFASSSAILLPPAQIGSLDNKLAFCFE
jgi:hypothetical protein